MNPLTEPGPSSSERVKSVSALLEAGQVAAAERAALEFLDHHPDEGLLWKILGSAQRRQGKNDRRAWIRAAELRPDDPEAFYMLGDVFRAASELAEAEKCYRHVLLINPREFGAQVNLGLVLHQAGRWDDAERAYRQAISIVPDSPQAQFNLALVLRQRGRFEEAASCFRAVLEIQPEFFAALDRLGATLHDLGDGAAPSNDPRDTLARHYFDGRQAVTRNDHNNASFHAKAISTLATALFAEGGLIGAEVAYRAALDIDSGMAEVHAGLGMVLLCMGMDGEANVRFAKALEIRPDYPELVDKRARLLFNAGRFDQRVAGLGEELARRRPWPEILPQVSDPWVLLDGLDLLTGEANCPAFPVKSSPGTVVAGPGLPPTSAATPTRHRPLRVTLIFPPPWRIGRAASAEPDDFDPPSEASSIHFDADFAMVPYGLLTLAAEVRSRGHEVEIINLSTSTWAEVEKMLASSTAEVFGLSAFTANRRGLGAVARLLRRHHKTAPIVAGGPFVTALPQAVLRHYSEIDIAVIGEGETTFVELLERISSKMPLIGVAGTAWRDNGNIFLGPPRERIRDLDQLASPFDYFASDMVMTSRGCPSECSFCGSVTTWGRKVRFHSVPATVDIFRQALAQLPAPVLAVKDDTFTAHRRRAIAICDALVEQKINFLWSCDTRIDHLDDDILRRMRLAGCQRISLGVESGAPAILEAIHKKTTPEAALEITAIARRYGFNVRYYMILGNRGESVETVRQSIDLVKAARPGAVSFSLLSFFPGTEEWEILRRRHSLPADFFFRNDFMELGVSRGRQRDWNDLLFQVQCEIGGFGFDFSIAEREAVVALFPDLHSAHAELASAYRKAGRHAEALDALDRAEALGFPVMGIIENQRACVALAQGDVGGALNFLERALRLMDYGPIRVNRRNLLAWAKSAPEFRQELPVLNDSVQALDFLPGLLTAGIIKPRR